MTVTSLVFGQINFLEVLGLAWFLSLSKSNKQYLAGASLVLTTIKPHLVILTLPILLLDLLRKKEWKTLAGFAIALAFCFIILFAFYPPWIQSFLGVVTSGMSTVRETPTVNLACVWAYINPN
jgi:putative effector of murein hydrolase